ncbi:MAG: hydrogenase maturation nickel metallochaperone HypA [Proteobacteria bacterium]|nr:hydrogenase maturation nickel metallochaperone HypA [Pseudomonadota bacterium]MBU1688751.1 hydrogenase maturation nickel metallochaperone HypA [Pseudomonadota bacterium]
MHEMSIAMSIIEQVSATARAEGARKVNTIELMIGPLAGVMTEALTFCFEAAAKDTPAEGAILEIHTTQATGCCLSCGQENEIKAFGDQCPSCNGFLAHTRGGDELRIMAITVDE